jgi:hypothetical protein
VLNPATGETIAEVQEPASSSAPRRRVTIEIATGGRPGQGAGFFHEPTVIAGARQADEIVRKEVFGPVVSVPRFMSLYALEDYGVVRHVMVMH